MTRNEDYFGYYVTGSANADRMGIYWKGAIRQIVTRPDVDHPDRWNVQPGNFRCVDGDANYTPSMADNQFARYTVAAWVMGGSSSHRYELLSADDWTADDLANFWIACVDDTTSRSYVGGLMTHPADEIASAAR